MYFHGHILYDSPTYIHKENTTMKNLFYNKNIRSYWDKVNRKYWFSAIDICMLLTGNQHKQAQSYWHTFKYKNAYFKPEQGYKNPQMTLLCADGSFRKTDVVDTETILFMIERISHKHNQRYQKYMLLAGVRKIVQRLNSIGRRGDEGTVDVARNKGKNICLFTYRVIPFKIGTMSKDTPIHDLIAA